MSYLKRYYLFAKTLEIYNLKKNYFFLCVSKKYVFLCFLYIIMKFLNYYQLKSTTMKKSLLFVFAVMFSAMLYAQSGPTQIFYEDFTGIEGTMFEDELYPKGWRTYYGGMSNWRIATGASYASCNAPELMFVYQPYFIGRTYLALPPLDLTGYDRVTISFYQNYNNGLAEELPTLGVASTLDELGWDDTWVFANSNIPFTTGMPEKVVVELAPEHVGQPEVIIAICLLIYDSGFTAWSFDNIEVLGYNDEGVSENLMTPKFEVYPNPVADMLLIEGENYGKVSIYNSLGVNVKNVEVSGSNAAIAVEDLANGTYIAVLNKENGDVCTTRFVIVK